MFEITNAKLFEDLVEFEFEGAMVDLHSDYLCVQIKLFENSTLCVFYFKHREEKGSIEIHFCSPRLSELNIDWPLNENASILEAFYRGRYEESTELKEVTKSNEKIYYLHFIEGININVFATDVFLKFN